MGLRRSALQGGLQWSTRLRNERRQRTSYHRQIDMARAKSGATTATGLDSVRRGAAPEFEGADVVRADAPLADAPDAEAIDVLEKA